MLKYKENAIIVKMKIKIILITSFLLLFLFKPQSVSAKTSFKIKPFKYSAPKNYKNGGTLKWQNGYLKKNGTYVQPHLKTSPDQYKWNNRKQVYGF